MTLEFLRVMKLAVKPKHLTCTQRAGFVFVVLFKLGNCCLGPADSVPFHSERKYSFTFCKLALWLKSVKVSSVLPCSTVFCLLSHQTDSIS